MKFLLFVAVLVALLFHPSSHACIVRIFDTSGELQDVVVLERRASGREAGEYFKYRFKAYYNPLSEEQMSLSVSWGDMKIRGKSRIRDDVSKLFLWIEPYVFQLSCQGI